MKLITKYSLFLLLSTSVIAQEQPRTVWDDFSFLEQKSQNTTAPPSQNNPPPRLPSPKTSINNNPPPSRPTLPQPTTTLPTSKIAPSIKKNTSPPLNKPTSTAVTTIPQWQGSILDPIRLDNSSRDELINLSLERALLTAIEQNIPQQIIDEAVKASRWGLFRSGSSLLPDVSIQNITTDTSRRSVALFDSSQTIYQTAPGISYDLSASELFDTIASYYVLQGSKQDRLAALQNLLSQTATAYYSLMQARGELAIYMEAVKDGRRNLALNQTLEVAGVGVKLSTLQAQEQLADNELALASQQAIARIAEVQLLTLMNMPLNSQIRLEGNLIEQLPLIGDKVTLRELTSLALSNQPTTDDFSDSLKPSQINDFRSASFTVNWELRGLGLDQAALVGQRLSECKQAELRIQRGRLDTVSSVRRAYLRAQATKRQVTIANKRLKAAEQSVQLARVRLENGIGTNIDLIDTQRNYINSMISKVQAITTYNQSQVSLLIAVGSASVENLISGYKL